MSAIKKEELKRQLADHLVPVEKVTTPPGLPTGIDELDHFLLWKGLPQGAITLLKSHKGQGATTLWIQTVSQLTQKQRWVAWIDGPGMVLSPWLLKSLNTDLSRLLVVSAPSSRHQLSWALQELIGSALFDAIGCDLRSLHLSDSQLLKLKRQARRFQVSLVLITEDLKRPINPFFTLVLRLDSRHIHVERAAHHPTPHSIERSQGYENSLPQLASAAHLIHR